MNSIMFLVTLYL
uniref:Uncharacterized protein n=1 Tax=Rhizophora mucronata TaxID=61149 RepID=A0A2P2QJP4_RHIMU